MVALNVNDPRSRKETYSHLMNELLRESKPTQK